MLPLSLRSNATRAIRFTRKPTPGPPIEPDPYSLFERFAGSDPLAEKTSSESPLLNQSDPIDVAPSEPSVNTAIQIFPPAQDPLLHYLASKLTHCGKRHQAARSVSRILMHIHGYTGERPLPIIREAILLVSPAVRVAMHKKGAKTIAKPMALNEKQRTRFGVEWILQASDKKPGNVEVRLAKEFIAVVRGDSEALKRREETHRSAMLNRYVLVYAHTGKFLIIVTLF
jgi:small subunit ribosomal protein S7